MPDYRLSKPNVPAPALAIQCSDAAFLAQRFGFELMGTRDAGRPLPQAVGLAADFHEINNVWLLDTTFGTGNEPPPVHQTTFYDQQPEWENSVHQEGCLLVLFGVRDFLDFDTFGQSLGSSWGAVVPLTIRATSSGVGTRGPV